MEALLSKLSVEVAAEAEKEKTKLDEEEREAKRVNIEKEEERALAADQMREAGVHVCDVEALISRVENDEVQGELNLNSHVNLDGSPALPSTSERVCAAMGNNTGVTHLLMAACNMNDRAAELLANALETNQSLVAINIETNDVHSPAVEKLVESLQKNTSLIELKLTNQKQPLHSATQTRLSTLLEPNETLVKLSADVKDQTAKNALEKVLYRNREIARKRRLAESGSSSKKSKDTVSDPCSVCSQSVYAAERLALSDTVILHKKCFRCATCKKLLSITNYSSLNDVFYCKPHYLKATKGKPPAGGGGGMLSSLLAAPSAGGSTKANANPTPAHIAAKFSGAHKESCSLCNERVYPTERLALDIGGGDGSIVVHASCLKCATCNKTLTTASFCAVAGETSQFFCSKHLKIEEERRLAEKTNQFAPSDEYSLFVEGKKSTITSEETSD